eukprot:IDg5256t1
MWQFAHERYRRGKSPRQHSNSTNYTVAPFDQWRQMAAYNMCPSFYERVSISSESSKNIEVSIISHAKVGRLAVDVLAGCRSNEVCLENCRGAHAAHDLRTHAEKWKLPFCKLVRLTPSRPLFAGNEELVRGAGQYQHVIGHTAAAAQAWLAVTGGRIAYEDDNATLRNQLAIVRSEHDEAKREATIAKENVEAA